MTGAPGAGSKEKTKQKPALQSTVIYLEEERKTPILSLFPNLVHTSPPSPLRWAECLSCAGGELKVALLLQNNTIETYSLKTSDKTPAANKTARLTLGGHRTDVRTLAFSSDNLAVLSASGDTVKIWNR